MDRNSHSFLYLIFAVHAKEIFGLPEWFGYLIGIPMSLIGVMFLLYPFVRGVKEFRSGTQRLGVMLFIFGIICPAVSGYISIIVIEVAGSKTVGAANQA